MLPALGGTCSFAWGLNNEGHVAGSSCLPGDTVRHAVLWRRHRLIDLGVTGPDTGSSAGQVNEHDDVAGGFARADGTVGAFFWRHGVSTDLGSLGGPNIFVSGLSEAGGVTGQADISDVVDPRFGLAPYHAFLWRKGDLIDLGQIFGSDFDTANAMNRAGKIVGAADLVGDQAAHAFSWDRGTINDLGAQLSDTVSWATSVNDRGQVVGTSGLFDDFPGDGPPSFTILCPCHAILWDRGVATVIDSFAGPDWTIDTPISINNSGEIIAYAHSNTVPMQVVLLTPIAQDDGMAPNSSVVPMESATSNTAVRGPARIHRTSSGEFRMEY
jgi:probable HAF family extracellular repeat protein